MRYSVSRGRRQFRSGAAQPEPLRKRLHRLPRLDPAGLRDCQISAIENLEASFKDDHPRALIQMATGSGKTYTAITAVYRLLKHADAKRILFLVDTRNLGEQAQQEFMAYVPSDDNRKFVELYNVQRLTSSFVASDSQVCISTIQRMYSILKGEEMDTAAGGDQPGGVGAAETAASGGLQSHSAARVLRLHHHRRVPSLDLRALAPGAGILRRLPDRSDRGRPTTAPTGSSERTWSASIRMSRLSPTASNVGNEVYVVETEKTQHGGQIRAGRSVEKPRAPDAPEALGDPGRGILPTMRGHWDRSVVNPDQIRTVIRTLRDKLPEIFPGRKEIPKTLIFAKTDSHADDIIQTVREEFGQGNEFCRKITYKVDGDPKSLLTQFRNDYYPRIAVTVDMIATGTDVKPLECLVFMRDVRSPQLLRADEGPRHPHPRPRRPEEGDALRHHRQDPLRHRGRGRRHQVRQDRQRARSSSKPGVPLKDLAHGRDDGRPRPRKRSVRWPAASPGSTGNSTTASGSASSSRPAASS